VRQEGRLAAAVAYARLDDDQVVELDLAVMAVSQLSRRAEERGDQPQS
jgi:hypothetical protein